MCGIAAAIGWPEAIAAVEGMTAGIHHRGTVSDPIASPLPDTAFYTRRLPIVDEARGQQPQLSFDSQISVTMNGEIYNHRELRAELEAVGITFRTDNDTEVLANALRAWGAGALSKLNGIYAFVALDLRAGAFLAARDPFGVKPLYVVQQGAGFLFSSEIAPLLAVTERDDVLLLPPGHLLTRDTCVRFYNLPYDSAGGKQGPAELDQILREAVAARLPDGLPAAALFSGGIDSTLMVHYARQQRADIPAYFVGDTDGPDYRFACDYAQRTHLNFQHVPFDLWNAGTTAILEQVVQASETFEPASIRPALYTYILSERIHADGFKVALCGEGADELFAGYRPLERAFAQSDAAGRFVQQQCLETMHCINLQRIDRCAMHFQLEIREPFLDARLVQYALRMGGGDLIAGRNGMPVGKQPLRAIYDLYPESLPAAIRDRTKLGFAEAAIDAKADAWSTLFEEAVSDSAFEDGKKQFADFHIASKEEYFYLSRLAQKMDVRRVPHLKERKQLFFLDTAKAA